MFFLASVVTEYLRVKVTEVFSEAATKVKTKASELVDAVKSGASSLMDKAKGAWGKLFKKGDDVVEEVAEEASKLGQKATGNGGNGKKGFTPPAIYKTPDGVPTNGKYSIDTKGMNRHRLNSSNQGKSQFLYDVDSDKAVLDAAAYADEYNLWGGSDHGNKAKVPVINGPVGVIAETGELTDYINVYRTADGIVHGSPARPPKQ